MRIGTLLFFLSIGLKCVFAQNATPVVSELSASINEKTRTIRVMYALKDTENDPITISLKVSNDGGETYLVNTSGARGNIGKGQTSGKGKEIVWIYPDSLNYVAKYKIKVIADDGQPISIRQLVDAVDSVRMKADMQKVYGIRSHENTSSIKHLESVRVLIESRMKGAGLTTKRQQATIKQSTFQNVITRKGGHGDESITYVLSAHMDTEKRSPGADDNASGIIGMLEAARILSAYQFKHSLRFVGFDGEEIGNIGSKMYAYSGIEKYEVIDAVINFDMIGFYSKKPKSQFIPDGFDFIFPEAVKGIQANGFRGDFILSTSNAQSREVASTFVSSATKFVPALRVVSLEAPDNGALALPSCATELTAIITSFGESVYVRYTSATVAVHATRI